MELYTETHSTAPSPVEFIYLYSIYMHEKVESSVSHATNSHTECLLPSERREGAGTQVSSRKWLLFEWTERPLGKTHIG